MSNQPEYTIISAKTLLDFCRTVLLKVQVPRKEAKIVANSLVSADLRGVDTHGTMALPRYVANIKSGSVRPGAKIEVIQDLGPTALWDGCKSLGQVLGIKAMQECIDKARTYGLGAIGVRRGSHFGAAGHYAMEALAHDMVGIASTTGMPVMAPWGGCTSLLGNHPLALAIPSEGESSIVLDVAMSVVSAGKLMLLKKQGKKKIPAGWALDTQGKITEDLEKALEGGKRLMPMGGHKGYGLSLAIDILVGILLGAGHGSSASHEKEGPGHLFAAIRVDAFRPIEEFKGAVHQRVRELKNSKLAKGTERILVPGEIEFETQVRRKKEGIPILHQIVEDLNQVAQNLGLKNRL